MGEEVSMAMAEINHQTEDEPDLTKVEIEDSPMTVIRMEDLAIETRIEITEEEAGIGGEISRKADILLVIDILRGIVDQGHNLSIEDHGGILRIRTLSATDHTRGRRETEARLGH